MYLLIYGTYIINNIKVSVILLDHFYLMHKNQSTLTVTANLYCGYTQSFEITELDATASDALISANDPSAAQRLQLGSLCLRLSSTVTLSLCLNLG